MNKNLSKSNNKINPHRNGYNRYKQKKKMYHLNLIRMKIKIKAW